MIKTINLVRFRAALSDFIENRSAVAYIEFAYSMPLLIPLFIGGVDLANLAVTHTRISQIVSQTADGAARVRDSIDEADINEVLLGASLGSGSLEFFTRGRVIISSLEDADGDATTEGQKVTWQRCKGTRSSVSTVPAQGVTTTNAIGADGRTIAATPGNPIVVVEAYYEYRSIFLEPFFGPQTIRYISAYPVRDRTSNAMLNGSNLSGTAIADCKYFNAT